MDMITGVSLERMELMSKDPMPGTRKICSVMTAPREDAGDLEGDEGHHGDESVSGPHA